MEKKYLDKIDKLEKRVEVLEQLLNKKKENGWGGFSKGIELPIKTNNQLRKEVIDEAKKFIKDNEPFIRKEVVKDGLIISSINTRTVRYQVDVKNKKIGCERWRMTAAVSNPKKMVKCSSKDVFNVHIGKAIALGRLLGLDTNKFEDTPQPDGIVEGMTVKCNKNYPKALSGGYYKGDLFKVIRGRRYKTEKYECHIGSDVACNSTIVDDSNAKY